MEIKMKIKLCPNWTSSEKIKKRLLDQFYTENISLDGIEFVYDDSYDIIVFFNYVSEPIVNDKKAYVFPHEPTWAGSHQKVFQDNTTVFGFDKDLYSGKCIEMLAHTFYGGRGDWMDPDSFWNYKFLSSSKFNKTKNISSSITKLKDDNGPTCLYPQRYKLAEHINNKFVDMYGGWINNSPKRHDALVDYKFNISIENEYHKNWISEKFYDCILTDTIPIYYGCKNIKDVYPEDGYILINDIDDVEGVEKMLNEINNNADDIYYKKLEGLMKIKQKYFQSNNLLKKIIEIK